MVNHRYVVQASRNPSLILDLPFIFRLWDGTPKLANSCLVIVTIPMLPREPARSHLSPDSSAIFRVFLGKPAPCSRPVPGKTTPMPCGSEI